ncbi:2-phosphosulfolactate phosphatase [Marinilongibacter aquaticus]|uniref:2-phosphosulfolactate phosphatase n=1 Tax=Marinilongibacter aquaticus TaxID=2975157 RepID=UPI0021BD3EE4|nr:2-phosphosulfolactate phosphatase [Marinilongibacter aquaticus]UBM57540.1 2-phosphosulfolactate phosphatase [Marinilongibacter aquaticus]
MSSLEICLSHELIHQHDLKNKIVVVTDVFRATSCIVAGIQHGIEAIKPVIEVEVCREYQSKGYLAGGERHALMIEGFDLDNSPFSYMKPEAIGKKVVMTTTNGTLAIDKSKQDADQVLVASFSNLSATANYLKSQGQSVVVVCAGWKGHPGLEDVLFGGALAKSLENTFELEGDSTHLALSTYTVAENNLLDYLQRASHLKRLKNLSGGKDIPFCLEIDLYDVVVGLNTVGELVKLA